MADPFNGIVGNKAQLTENATRLCVKCSVSARAMLVKLLGPATVVVKNGDTDAYLYYQLKRPAESIEDRAALELVREFVAKITGGDSSDVPPEQLSPEDCYITDQNFDAALNLITALRILYRADQNGGASIVGEEPDLQPGLTQEGNGQLTHDKAMASTFLTGLDPTATRFTFQTFDDNKDRKNKTLTKVLHGTLDECFAELIRLNKLGAGIFVTISATTLLGRRITENIVRPRALFYDADGDEQVEHSETVIKECDAPPSMMVISGGGRHGYYICDDIPLDRFSALQKSLIAKLGTDRNVHDLPRVMRLPGFLHCKDPSKPRLVKLVATDGAVRRWKLSDLIDKLGLSTTTPDRTNGRGADGRTQQSASLEIAEAFKGLDPSKNVAAGIVVPEIPPLPFPPIKEGCAWLREAHDTGGKEFDEPQWYLTTRAATFLENGHELAHQFGSRHPDYTHDSTEEKWERANKTKDIGWPQCKTISENGGKPHCSKCPHFAKGKSPLNIGFDAARDESDNEELRQLGGTRPPELRLPEDFCLNEDGIVCAFIPSKIVKGKVQKGGLLPLTNNRISAPSLQLQNGRFGIGFTASTDRGGMTEVLLTSTQCYKEHGLLKQLAEKAVMYTPGKAAGELIEKFFVDWFNKLRCEDVAIRDHGTLGWRYKDGEIVGFVYGNTLYHEDGSEMSIVAASDNEFRSHYMPTGDRETWLAAAKLLTDRKRPELDTIIAIGFAAPLMAFAGTLYGAILSIWGDPGTSKSTAQQVAAAVWGHPKQTRESLNSTPKSVQKRLGLCRNLAAYWDDIQDERHQDALFNTMFVATQGAEGGRLNQDASMKERLEWQTLLAACSNASFIEYLTKKQKSTTAGMRRLFEFKYDKKDNEPGMVNLVDAMQAFAALEHNFGRIGAEYARILATEHKDLAAKVSESLDSFREAVNGTVDENYWWGLCGVLLAGAELANRLGAELDIEAMRAFLIEAYHDNRKVRGAEGTEGGSLANTEQWLAAFLNDYSGRGHAMWTDKVFDKNRHIKIAVLHEPEKDRYPIYVQVACDQRLIIINKREMKNYLEKHEVQTKGVFDGLVKYFKATGSKRTIGAGTAQVQVQEPCFTLPVSSDQSILYEFMTRWGPPKA